MTPNLQQMFDFFLREIEIIETIKCQVGTHFYGMKIFTYFFFEDKRE